MCSEKVAAGGRFPMIFQIGTPSTIISTSGKPISIQPPNYQSSHWSKKKLVRNERRRDGRKDATTMFIVDAQSVKNTDPAELKGYDGGKKVSGIKRHLAVDSQGLPHLLWVTTANISDKAGAREMLVHRANEFQEVEKVLVDGGYNGRPFEDFADETLGAEVEVAKRNELHKFAVIPKRWVVERSISWLEKCRRLWKNCERKLETSLAFMRLAFISLLLRRI